ncbi:hypothetical protein FRC01_004640 [Tulasnella sp. 417]|nr:hypothetical protein FRC01_004640 [Tulasnella sp. 417]
MDRIDAAMLHRWMIGNTTVDKAYNNTFKVYQVIQTHLDAHPEDVRRFPNFRKDGHKPFYAKGAQGPLQGQMNLAEYFHGPDGLSDISTTHPQYDVKPSFWPADNPYLNMSSKPAHEVILDVLEREPVGTVTLLACGPLTNVSRAFSTSPEIFSRVRRVVSMGGNLDVPGNTSATSEFNFFADPYAARHLLEEVQKVPSPFEFVLVPLDITSKHTITFDQLIPRDAVDGGSQVAQLAEPERPIETFISTLLRRPRKVLSQLGLTDDFEMHDPLAAWYVIRSAVAEIAAAEGWKTIKRKFVIETAGEYTKGMCVVDRRGSKEEVGTKRAVQGIVIDHEKEEDQETGEEHGIDVLLRWPDSKIFINEMMRRVFWYSP